MAARFRSSIFLTLRASCADAGAAAPRTATASTAARGRNVIVVMRLAPVGRRAAPSQGTPPRRLYRPPLAASLRGYDELDAPILRATFVGPVVGDGHGLAEPARLHALR